MNYALQQKQCPACQTLLGPLCEECPICHYRFPEVTVRLQSVPAPSPASVDPPVMATPAPADALSGLRRLVMALTALVIVLVLTMLYREWRAQEALDKVNAILHPASPPAPSAPFGWRYGGSDDR